MLHAAFRETWGQMLETISGIEAAGGPAREQVRKVSAVVLGSWKANPDLIRVLIREVARGPQLEQEIKEIGQAFYALERIVRRGVETGEFRPELDSRVASRGPLRGARRGADRVGAGTAADGRRRDRRDRAHRRIGSLRRPGR